MKAPSGADGPTALIVAALKVAVNALADVHITTPFVQADVDACVSLLVSIILVSKVTTFFCQ